MFSAMFNWSASLPFFIRFVVEFFYFILIYIITYVVTLVIQIFVVKTYKEKGLQLFDLITRSRLIIACILFFVLKLSR